MRLLSFCRSKEHVVLCQAQLSSHPTFPSLFQLRVIAYDSASPARTATSTVNIQVSRNPSAPVFTRAVYEQTIPETYPLGTAVETVLASDADGVRRAILYCTTGGGVCCVL